MGQNKSKTYEGHSLYEKLDRRAAGRPGTRRTVDEVIRKGFSPTNTFILIVNIFLFGLLIIFWYWFIGSQQLFSVIDKKAEEINNLMENDISLNASMQTYITQVKNDTGKIERVRLAIENRNIENITKFREYFLGPVLILVILGVVYFVYIVKFKEFHMRDVVLILIMVLMFMTEVIFFFVVINNFKFIPTSTVLVNLLEKHNE